MRPKTEAARRGEDWLGGAKGNQADFGRDAQAYWSADCAEAAIHVNMRHGRRSRGEERGAERQSGGDVRSTAFLGGRRQERALGEGGGIVVAGARRAEGEVEEFDLR